MVVDVACHVNTSCIYRADASPCRAVSYSICSVPLLHFHTHSKRAVPRGMFAGQLVTEVMILVAAEVSSQAAYGSDADDQKT